MRTLHWMMMVSLGFILRPSFYEENVINLIFPLIAVAFLWQYTTMINDIYDIGIDRKVHPDRPLVSGEIEARTYRNMAYFSLLFAMFFSFLSSFFVLLMSFLFFSLAIVYSVPPVRIRNKWYGSVIMGTASAIEVSAGYFSHFWVIDGHFFYFTQPNILMVDVLILVFFALSIAPNITAYMDYKGDIEAGVCSIYTVLGKERGKTVVSVMLFILFLLPSILFPTSFNIMLGLSLGLITYVMFSKYECAKCVFTMYFIELIYFIIYFLYLK